MALFPFSELNEPEPSIGRNAGRQVARAARDFVCSIYRNTPGAIWRTPISELDEFARGLFDSACAESPSGLPPAPQPPFTGGQCPGVLYNVVIRVEDPGNRNFVDQYGVAHPGPIGGVSRVFGALYGDIAPGVTLYTSMEVRINNTVVRTYGGMTSLTSVQIVSINRIDGQPDTCGDPPREFPDPPVNTPNVFNDNRTIVNNDGTDFNIPISYTPTISIPVTVQVGGINVNIDFDGVDIPTGTKEGVDLTPILDAVENVNDKVGDILDDIAQRDAQPGDPSATNGEPSQGEGDANDFPGEILEWVQVDIKSKPSNAKSQYGAGAPDLYYCGWFSFRCKGRQLPREPIHYLGCIFRAPDGCDGFSYTVYGGFDAIATPYLRPKKDQGA